VTAQVVAQVAPSTAGIARTAQESAANLSELADDRSRLVGAFRYR
jgi:hypothetical protein